jgi:hypothetical protein
MGLFKPTDIFTETNEKLHAAKRRMASNAYSHSSIVEMEHFVDDTSKLFFKRLDEEFVKKGMACDFSDWLQYYAFDVRLSFTLEHISSIPTLQNPNPAIHTTASLLY